MYDWGGANHEGTEAIMQAKARAGQLTAEDAPEGRVMATIRNIWWSLVLVATLAGIVWAFGGTPATIVAVVIATVGALLLVVAWRVLRNGRRGSTTEDD
jgi:uncharacterized membrane protein YeaQ/YmgE (transglycosylase-associated protein family)